MHGCVIALARDIGPYVTGGGRGWVSLNSGGREKGTQGVTILWHFVVVNSVSLCVEVCEGVPGEVGGGEEGAEGWPCDYPHLR